MILFYSSKGLSEIGSRSTDASFSCPIFMFSGKKKEGRTNNAYALFVLPVLLHEEINMNMLDRIRLQNTLDVNRSVRNLQSLDRNMRNTNPS